jgi:hypothetical protein
MVQELFDKAEGAVTELELRIHAALNESESTQEKTKPQ